MSYSVDDVQAALRGSIPRSTLEAHRTNACKDAPLIGGLLGSRCGLAAAVREHVTLLRRLVMLDATHVMPKGMLTTAFFELDTDRASISQGGAAQVHTHVCISNSFGDLGSNTIW